MKDCISRLKASLAYLAGESGYSYKKWSTHKTSSIFGINKTANHQRPQDFCKFMIALFSLRPKALDLSLYDTLHDYKSILSHVDGSNSMVLLS